MNPWRGMNQRLSPPPERVRPVVVAFSELDRLEELARAAHRERAEGWTTGPAISRLQDATPSGVILTLVAAARVAARLLQEAGPVPAGLELGNDKGPIYAAVRRVESILDEAVISGALDPTERRLVHLVALPETSGDLPSTVYPVADRSAPPLVPEAAYWRGVRDGGEQVERLHDQKLSDFIGAAPGLVSAELPTDHDMERARVFADLDRRKAEALTEEVGVVPSLFDEIERLAAAPELRYLNPCAECGHAMVHHGHIDEAHDWIDDGRCFVWLPAQKKPRRSAGCKCKGWH